MYNSNQNVHVCVATELCRKIYVKYTTKQAMTSEVLLYQNAYDMYHILQTMKTNIYVHHVIKDYKKQVMKTQFYHTMENIHMQ